MGSTAVIHILSNILTRSANESSNQATGYASQHIPVPVPSQDKLGGLQQEGHPA